MTRPPTHQQLELLRCWADGMTYAQIARRMRMSEGTVKGLAARLMARLDAVNAANAVHVGWTLGYLGPREQSDG